jgi:hypothetical protein
MAPKYNIATIKQIATSFKARLDPIEAKTDGYLLEIAPGWYKQCETAKRIAEEKGESFNPDKIEKDYELLALSLMGSKYQCEAALRMQLKIHIHLQRPNNYGEQTKTNRHKKQHYFSVDPRKEDYKLETESEHVMAHSADLVLVTKEKEVSRMNITQTSSAGKTETGEYRFVLTLSAGAPELVSHAIQQLEKIGTISDLKKYVTGSLYRRVVAINPKIKAENLNGDSKEGYLIGETLAQARDQFWNVLDKLPAPIQPEWEEELWKRFTAHGSKRITGVDTPKWRKEHDITDAEFALLIEMQPWVDELVGHRMFGYKLNLNKEAIQLLISALVYSDVLANVIPIPPAPAAKEPVAEIEEEIALAA